MSNDAMSVQPSTVDHQTTLFLEEIGPRWGLNVAANVRRVVKHYDPILAKAPKENIVVHRNIQYGSGDERQQLDIFTKPEYSCRPVVMFVHGGAFVEGSRNRSDEVYSNVLNYFSNRGMVGVNVEYRLAPKHSYPAGSEDMALAVDWVVDNIEKYGGDPKNVFLMGHSAGGAHVASYCYEERFGARERVRGAIIISGRVRADNNVAENPNAHKVSAYYGNDASVYERVSPVNHVSSQSPPTFIAFAEYENPLIDVYCLELAYKLALENRKAPTVVRVPRHNHTSIIAHLNTSEDWLGRQLCEFVSAHAYAQG
mgnify:CR=1 FL=1